MSPRKRRMASVKSRLPRAKRTRLMTSAPCAICGLRPVRTPTIAPLARSISCAAIVVLPTSMATPRPWRLHPAIGDLSVRTGAAVSPTSSSKSASARILQASRHPLASSAREKTSRSQAVAAGLPFNTRTPHPPQARAPPQGRSTPWAASEARREDPRSAANDTSRGSSRMVTASLIGLSGLILSSRLQSDHLFGHGRRRAGVRVRAIAIGADRLGIPASQGRRRL